jgi:APA family basic amino acid/polyamine antiporter
LFLGLSLQRNNNPYNSGITYLTLFQRTKIAMLDRILDKDTVEAMFRRKSLADAQDTPEDGTTSTTTALRRSLTAVDLVLYGVGSSVGAGIFVLVGLGAKIAGPAIAVSFLGCGMACTLTSFAYSEFASLIPASGSAFTYTYVAFGEFLAFLVGWNLILGYGFTASVTARAWADYMGNFLFNWTGQEWIQWMTEFPIFGTQVHYTCSPLSIIIIAGSTAVLLKGSKESSTFNNLMTITNLSILLLVVFSGLVSGSVSNENLTPFFPKGLPGVLQGAGLVFFAFIGFVSQQQLTWIDQFIFNFVLTVQDAIFFATNRIW